MCGALQYVGDPNGRRGGVGDHQHQEGAAIAEAGDEKNKRTKKATSVHAMGGVSAACSA